MGFYASETVDAAFGMMDRLSFDLFQVIKYFPKGQTIFIVTMKFKT